MSVSPFNIPKILHLIWIGDTHKRPDQSIQSWRDRHQDWTVKLWGDDELNKTRWLNQHHLETFISLKMWPAVADLMRYEILYREGGVYVDADSWCLRSLDDWLLQSEFFACWGEALGGAGLVNNAFIGTIPRNPFLLYVIQNIARKRQVISRWSWRRFRYVKMGAWRSVGPYCFTQCLLTYQGGYRNASIFPSHMFSPNHFRNGAYTGGGLSYADHQWSSTTKTYALLESSEDGLRPHDYRLSKAQSRSLIKSSAHSMPTDNLTSPPVIPSSARASSFSR